MQFFSKYFVMKLLKSLLAPVFASVILSACTLDAERPTDVQHIDKNDITWQQHLKKIKQIQSYSTKGQIGTSVHKSVFLVALNGNIKTLKPIS